MCRSKRHPCSLRYSKASGLKKWRLEYTQRSMESLFSQRQLLWPEIATFRATKKFTLRPSAKRLFTGTLYTGSLHWKYVSKRLPRIVSVRTCLNLARSLFWLMIDFLTHFQVFVSISEDVYKGFLKDTVVKKFLDCRNAPLKTLFQNSFKAIKLSWKTPVSNTLRKNSGITWQRDCETNMLYLQSEMETLRSQSEKCDSMWMNLISVWSGRWTYAAFRLRQSLIAPCHKKVNKCKGCGAQVLKRDALNEHSMWSWHRHPHQPGFSSMHEFLLLRCESAGRFRGCGRHSLTWTLKTCIWVTATTYHTKAATG